jgi:hypothetical protein
MAEAPLTAETALGRVHLIERFVEAADMAHQASFQFVDIKHQFPGLAIVGSAYTYLQEWLPHIAQHNVRTGRADFVGLGRILLSYPDYPADVLAGRPPERKRLCRTFSDCTTASRRGLVSGCYPLDPLYKSRSERERLATIKARLKEAD